MRKLLTKLRWIIRGRSKTGRAYGSKHSSEQNGIRDTTHGVWAAMWLDRLLQDVRYGARLLASRPVLSVTAIATLMLGMGGTTAMFSLLDALLMRRLPVARPDDLMSLAERRRDGTPVEAFTLATHETLQRGSQTFSGVIASSRPASRPAEIKVGDEWRAANIQLVSDNYFDVLGVGALRGQVFHQSRVITAEERVAVISEDYWQRQYNRDPNIVGKRFSHGLHDFTISGVAARGFRGAELDSPVDIWIRIEQIVPLNSAERTEGRWVRVMGRLRPGVARIQAEGETTILLGRPIQLQSAGTGYSTLRMRLYQPLVLVALAAGLVLLIACANLANLMLAATISREREIAVRAALGASRARIFWQLATESFVLSVAGATLSLGVAYWLSHALLAFLPPEQANALSNLRFELDGRVLGFVALLSVGTCVLFGIVPAFQVTGRATGSSSRTATDAGRGHHSLLSRGLLVGQVVMCMALLVIAGVFFRTVQNLRGQQSGYVEDGLLIADIGFPRAYPELQRDQRIEELRMRVSALPGVQVAAFSHVGQLSGGALRSRITFPGLEQTVQDQTSVIEQRISPGFLQAMGTPVRAGREFRPSDDERAPLVAIVNESFVRRFLADRNALGAVFSRESGPGAGKPIEIVGVVADSKWINLRDDSPAMYYRPYQQVGGTPTVRLAVRTSGDAEPLSRSLFGVAQSVDKQIQLSNVVPFREIVDRVLTMERLIAQVSTAFGALALSIAAVGLYGVLAYSVARRRKEIGLRMAIGAQRGAITRMFLRESLLLVSIGMTLGVLLAIFVTRSASSMLFGLSPHDPATIGVAIGTFLSVASVATYLPARRAARVDPLLALRQE